MKALIILILALCALPKKLQEWLLLCISCSLPFLLICFFNEKAGYLITISVFIFLILCYFFPILDILYKFYKNIIKIKK